MRKLIGLFALLTFVGLQVCFAQTKEVKGLVLDKTDKTPIPGVSVYVKTNPGAGTATDMNGTFTLTVNENDVLTFTFIGMKPQEIPVKGKNYFEVVMEPSAEALEEVVVIGYGTRKKGSITGSVSVVESKKLESTPVASFDQVLQGQAPGLQVYSNSGQPNQASTFMLRGVNSINAGTAPLFIVDGMQMDSRDFASINPADIANVSILKDASSTAIYGARATNGVIIITTKRGSVADKARINVRGQWGFSTLAYGKWDLMNTKEKLDYEEEIGLHAGDPTWNRADWEGTDVDWRDAIFADNAFLQDYELSVSGATPKTNYYISGNFHDQDGITYGTKYQRYSIRTNLETKANNWFKIGANMSASYEKYTASFENEYYSNTPLGAVSKMNPYWNPFKPDGSVASQSDGSWKGNGQNPLEFIDSRDEGVNKAKFLLTGFLEVTPVKGLSIKSLGGVDFMDQRTTLKTDPDFVPNEGEGVVNESFTRRYRLLITNTIDYQFTINEDHSLRFLLGQEGNYYNGSAFGIIGYGFTDKRLQELGLATTFKSGSSSKVETTYLSYFGRAEYNFREKYFADATYRRDGSSRFGTNSKWGDFWSLGLMWNAKKENFLAGIDWLTNTQVSFSVGTQGNSSIDDYAYYSTVAGGASYDDVNGIVPTIGNPNLSWEKTRTINVGLRLGFWDRLNVSFDAYHKLTSDMLMQVPYSLTSGFSKGWDNVGKMKNVGFEFDIKADVIRNADFYWNISANFSYNKNEITELYNGKDEYTESNTGLQYKVGHPYGEFLINRFAGVNPMNGDALWYTKDGEITNQYREEDQVLTGKTFFAPWAGGFSTSLGYKGLNLSAQFSWVADRYMINNDRYFSESNGKFSSENQSKTLLYDRWKKPGDIAKVPRHGVVVQFDDRLLEDASFMRLKNLMVSYDLPKTWMRKTGVLSSVRVYAQAQNLFTITNFKGLDPESSSNIYKATYPLSRQFTFGLDVQF